MEDYEFKDRLREARLAAGKTQKECAESFGAVEHGYQQYELGYRIPSALRAAELARFLDVSIDWLTGLSNDPAIHDKTF